MIRVRFHGALRYEVGLNYIDVNGTQLAEVFLRLPDDVRTVLRRYEKYLIILVNGRRVYDLNILLDDDSVVDVMLPLGGG